MATCYSYPHTHRHRFPHYFVTNPHRSGAGHVTTLMYILQGSRAYRSGTGLQLPSYTHRFPHYFVTDSHQSGTGHVITQIYILQGSRAYRSGTGLHLPPYTQISSSFCHQFPPIRCWSCLAKQIYTGCHSLSVRSPIHFSVILSPVPTILVLVM